jgi:hypothetical protein
MKTTTKSIKSLYSIFFLYKFTIDRAVLVFYYSKNYFMDENEFFDRQKCDAIS